MEIEYKEEERELIENAKKFFMEESPKKTIDKENAETKEILNFYHNRGLISTPEDHIPYRSLMKKLDEDYVDSIEEDNKKKQAEAERLIKFKNDGNLKDLEVIMEKETKLSKEIKKKQRELLAKREAELKALKEEKERIKS